MTHEIIGRYICVEGTRIYYEECGTGIPLFCIHSANCCSLEFKDFLPLMAARGFRVICPDLPGHGKSYPVNWQPFRKMREFSEFTWKIAKAVCGDEKPVVTGISIGGNMTIDLACYHSNEMRAAIAQEGAAFTQTYADFSQLEHPHAVPSWHAVIAELHLTQSTYQPADKLRLTEQIWNHRYTCQEVGAGDIQCWTSQDVRAELKNITCPIMIIKGAADYFVPEALVDEAIAGIRNGLGEKLVIDNVGHFPSQEQPEQLAEVFMEFLKRREVI